MALLFTPTSLDMNEALNSADWRRRLSVPVTPPLLRVAFQQSIHSYMAFLNDIAEDSERDIGLLAVSLLVPRSRTLIEAAFVAQAELEGFPQLGGRIPEVDYLRTGDDQTLAAGRWWEFAPYSARKTSLNWLRQLKAPLNWVPFWRLPKSVISSDKVVSFNSHLVSVLQREGRAAAAGDADHLLALARENYVSGTPHDVSKLAGDTVTALTNIADLKPEILLRLKSLLAPIVLSACHHSAADLNALRQLGNLPTSLICGTGFNYSGRAVSLMVMERGGRVERFEHGAPLGMVSSFEGAMLSDISVATHYVMMSEPKIEMFQNLGPTRLFPKLMNVELRSGGGDTNFSSIPSRTAEAPSGRRKRILYGPTAFRGHQQYEQPLLLDMVYLDWQLRLVEEMSKLSIEVVLKPHPQSSSGQWREQFTGLCKISDAPFEQLIPEVDAIVCDYPQSTTFWGALCSDRPVVLIDLGISPLNPALEDVYGRRCTILQSSYDENGIPQTDFDVLREAIRLLPDRVDSADLRRFFVAE